MRLKLRSLRLIFKYTDQLRAAVKHYPQINFDKRSDRELFNFYKHFIDAHDRLWSIAMVPNLLEFENSYLSDYLLKYIDERLVVISQSLNKAEVFSFLLADQRLSQIQKQEMALLRIIRFIQNKQFKESRINTRTN